MKIRAALLTGVVVAGALAGTSLGAAKKSCNLIKDDKGDSAYGAAQNKGDGSIDIVSADLGSSTTQITAIIRVDKLQKTDSQAPLGQAWFFSFIPTGLDGADNLFLAAASTPSGGDEFWLGHQGKHPQISVQNTSFQDASATGVFDEAKSEIRITAKISDFGKWAPLLAPGKKWTTLLADARRLLGQRKVRSQFAGPVYVPLGGLTTIWDTAEGTSYVAATPSCVAVGK